MKPREAVNNLTKLVNNEQFVVFNETETKTKNNENQNETKTEKIENNWN